MLLATLFLFAQTALGGLAPAVSRESTFGDEASGQAEESLRRSVLGECTGIVVTSPQVPGHGRAPFSATHILDLRLAVQMRRRLAGRHVLAVEIFTPRGHLYQTLTVPFAGTAPRVRWVDGAPGLVSEQTPREVDSGLTRMDQVEATLPVGGTAILSNALYGRWRAVAYLDGSTQACGADARFEIGP
jgi:hypothetical protein